MNAFKTKPFNHQLDSLNASRGKPYFADLSEMGTGKSWTRINEIALLFGDGTITDVLIIAPKGVHSNWILSQIPQHMPDWVNWRGLIWRPSPNRKQQAEQDAFFKPTEEKTVRVFAANWDALQFKAGVEFIWRFIRTSSRVLFIGDEFQRMKNPKSERTKALMKMRKEFQIKRIMSGTPVLNSPFDLFAPFTFLDETILGTTSFFAFKAEYAEMLQPGNALLDAIVKGKTRLSKDDRAAVNTNISELNAMLERNGRAVLIEIGAEMSCAMETSDYEIVLAKTQQLAESMAPGVSDAKTAVMLRINKINALLGAHIKKTSRAVDPRRLPQIVAKGKGGFPKYRNLEKLEALIKPHTFRALKAECLDLPEKVYTQTWYELSPKQAEAYRLMKNEARMIVGDGGQVAIAKLATLMKMSQICSGYMIEPITKAVIRIEGPNPKLELLEDRLEGYIEDGRRIIVWARFTEESRDIVALCQRRGWRYCVYNGQTSDKDRAAHIAGFEAGEFDVFIGQQRAGGTGITLITATRTIYYSNTFSAEDRWQSEDRMHRIGQKETCVYEDLLGEETVDIKIVGALRNKQNIADAITGDKWRKMIDFDEEQP